MQAVTGRPGTTRRRSSGASSTSPTASGTPALYQLHRDLLRLRRTDPAFRSQRRCGVDGAVLGDQAFVLRYFLDDGMDRLLVVNFGRDLHLRPARSRCWPRRSERRWAVALHTEDPKYGGGGTGPIDTRRGLADRRRVGGPARPRAGRSGPAAFTTAGSPAARDGSFIDLIVCTDQGGR